MKRATLTCPMPDNSVSTDPARILIVGRDRDARAFVRNALSLYDYNVLEAVNSEEAKGIIDQLDGVNLIVGCSDSDQETSEMKRLSAYRPRVRLLVFPAAERRNWGGRGEEIMVRVRLALEAPVRTRSILIVAEDSSERSLLASLLEAAAYRVRETGSPKAAFSLLAKDPPDVVLTDIVMSERDGLDVIQELRKRFPSITAIAMCGGPRADSYLQVARLIGAKAVLKKPLNFEEVLRALRGVFENEQ